MNVIILISSVLAVLGVLRLFRNPIFKYLSRLKIKLRMGSLRDAIHKADDDKTRTDRKNMVVYNTASGKFEPMQKKVLKSIAKNGKNKNNGAMTDGRKWAQRNLPKKTRVLDIDRVKEIEEKSLYVTK